MNISVKIPLIIPIVLLAACTSDGPGDPPDGAIRFIHAATTLSTVEFLLVQRNQGTTGYAAATDSFELDEDTYTINVDTLSSVSADERERIISEQRGVTAFEELLLVLYDVAGVPALTPYSLPINPVEEGSVEFTFLHAAKGASQVALYLEPDGADLLAATPRDTLAFQQLGTPFVVATGSFRVTATVPGDPTSVVYQSPSFTPSDASSAIISVFASAGTARAPLRVSIFDRTTVTPLSLNDLSAPAALRFVNGAIALGSVDVVADGEFAQPLHAAVQPGEIRDYAELANLDPQIQITPAGNPGVIEFDQTLSLAAGNQQTLVVAGASGAVSTAVYLEDNRGIAPRTRVRIRNLAVNASSLDVYVTTRGGGIAEALAAFLALPATGVEFQTSLVGGDFDVIVVENDSNADTVDETVIAGPVAVNWPNSQVFEVLVFDGAVAGDVDVVVSNVTAPQP